METGVQPKPQPKRLSSLQIQGKACTKLGGLFSSCAKLVRLFAEYCLRK